MKDYFTIPRTVLVLPSFLRSTVVKINGSLPSILFLSTSLCILTVIKVCQTHRYILWDFLVLLLLLKLIGSPFPTPTCHSGPEACRPAHSGEGAGVGDSTDGRQDEGPWRRGTVWV